MAVTFGAPVKTNFVNGTSTALALSGVTSGQPIVVVFFNASHAAGPTGISDNFSTPYTWTQVDSDSGATSNVTTYIGTGGAGTSGTVTLTNVSGYVASVATPCIGATTASGLSAIDVHGITTGTTGTIPSVSLTPSVSGEGAIYAVLPPYQLVGFPGSPWVNTEPTLTGNVQACSSSYASPSSGTALTTSWAAASSGTYVTAGLIVRIAPTVPGAPTIGTATAGDTQSTVTWTAPGSNGGASITGYTITPYIGASAQSATTVGNVLTYSVTGLTDGTAYTFEVAAINSVGTGSNSGASNSVTPFHTYTGNTGSLVGTFGATGSGRVVVSGTGSMAGTFGGASAGLVVLNPTGSLVGTFGAQATGLVVLNGTGSLVGTFGAQATGIPFTGVGVGSMNGTFGGVAAGLINISGTGSLVGTFGAQAVGVQTWHASGSLVGAFGAFANAIPGPGALLAPAVSALAGCDEKTPIITISVLLNINSLFGAFSIGVTLLRNDGTYVIGASPLDPLIVLSTAPAVTIVDEAAPYGLPTTYIATSTILGGLGGGAISPPSIPSLPITMGQAPDTADLYGRMGWAHDEDTGGVLEQWLSGVGQLIQTVDNLCRDGEDANDNPAPGWSQVLDINRAPNYVLPWLAQFLGVRLDPSLRDDQMRAQIENPAGFARGTPGYITAAANQYLIPGWTITLHERDTSPYHLLIDVPQAGLAGVGSYRSIWSEYPTYAAVQSAFATYADVWFLDFEIISAIDATIPAGLRYQISFV